MSEGKRFSISGILNQRVTPASKAPVTDKSLPPAQSAFPPSQPSHQAQATPRPKMKESPKAKKSFTLSPENLNCLEVLAWYSERSCSSILDELLARYVSEHVDLHRKASAAQAEAKATGKHMAAAG